MGRALVQAVVGLPLILPPTVLGFYLLMMLGPVTAPGRLIVKDARDTRWRSALRGWWWGPVIYSLPFAVQPLVAGFRGVGSGVSGSGCRTWVWVLRETFWRVVLPMSAGVAWWPRRCWRSRIRWGSLEWC